MVRAVLFDLDGTLLPMDQDVFVKAYMGGLAKKMAHYGYDPKQLIQVIWAGTAAMVANDGRARNEEVLWSTFCDAFGENAQDDESVFVDFYHHEFQDVRNVCGFDPQAAETVAVLTGMGLRCILATNPLFPAVATYSRVRWAGLQPESFELITTYENSRFCKPNPDYYREILDKLQLLPEECLMVGNDVGEDMIARELGIKVFLLTDCLINRNNSDIENYPNGSFPELLNYIRSL